MTPINASNVSLVVRDVGPAVGAIEMSSCGVTASGDRKPDVKLTMAFVQGAGNPPGRAANGSRNEESGYASNGGYGRPN